jgi:prepilin-type N-terminal cleavage/methylation domain-containing protein
MFQKLSQRRPAAGFTLIEIIVVAVMIAILSAIGLISVQSFMGRARIRVVLGETYQIASAMSFARDDIGFYTKLSFLLLGENEIGQSLGQIDATNRLNTGFEYFGNDVDPLTTRVATGWAGPYMGMSQGRRGLGGPTIVSFVFPSVTGSGLGSTSNPIDGPGDAWNQPYVLYLMNIDTRGNIGFINSAGASTSDVGQFTDVPNFFSAVVSHGPNGRPAGELTDLPSQFPAAAADAVNGNQFIRDNMMLYRDLDVRTFVYETLEPEDYNDPLRITSYFGVVDRNSDDLVKEF